MLNQRRAVDPLPARHLADSSRLWRVNRGCSLQLAFHKRRLQKSHPATRKHQDVFQVSPLVDSWTVLPGSRRQVVSQTVHEVEEGLEVPGRRPGSGVLLNPDLLAVGGSFARLQAVPNPPPSRATS